MTQKLGQFTGRELIAILRRHAVRQRVLLCDSPCDHLHMATNLAIDPDLLERAVAVSGERTKTAAVKRALEEFIARREQGKIVELFGSLEWDPQYDYKAARSRR